jgi:hypothetical protein
MQNACVCPREAAGHFPMLRSVNSCEMYRKQPAITQLDWMHTFPISVYFGHQAHCLLENEGRLSM